MRHTARISLLVTLVGVLLVGALAPAAQASFGPETFEAGTCITKTCTYKKIEEHSDEQFTQAAGHPPWGGTKFIMKHSGSSIEGESVKRLRVDVPAGLAANPQAPMPKCTIEQFDESPKGCPPSSEVGTTEMEVVAEPFGPSLPLSLPKLEGTVYNLEAPAGLPLDFGIAVEPAGELITPIHLFLEGHVSWAHEPSLAARGVPSADYHEWFEINNVPNKAEVKALLGVESPIKVLMSKLNFDGHAGGNFLTLPSVCSITTTSYLELESWSHEIADTVTHTPVGVEGCDKVPFAPTTTIAPETSTSDEPDGVTVDIHVPQKAHENEINTADIEDAHVTLPEGMTLDPPAANGLSTCSPSQIGIGEAHPVECPSVSKIGTVAIETDLPLHSLTGNVYLGDPSGGPITGPPFTIYIDAESVYGVSVGLQGQVNANPNTGRLETTFLHNPQLPFSDLLLTFGGNGSGSGNARVPLANPLSCGTGQVESLFTPYTGATAAFSSQPFTITGCPNPLPFALSQAISTSNPNAGGYTNFTFNLARSDGQQYLSGLTTTLPAGLVGEIPSVPLCGEPQADQGVCPSTSEIGSATITAGAGSEPYPFAGHVYLTGPYDGAPYGLSIVVPAIAGPFNLGDVVTRAAIGVNEDNGRVIVTSSLPTIAQGVGRPSSGVPLRLKSISVAVTRPNFMLNPTNCGPLATESTLTSTFGATQSISSPFQVGNCGALTFKPSFAASTSAHTSKEGGASLRVTLAQPAHEANIASVFAQLPARLVSRLTTLNKACPEATFAANPVDCRPLGSEVGTAAVTTPILPSPPPGREANLTGSAYLVSHGGEAFPDLDLVLEGDGGVRVVLVGHTKITKGITSSDFASIPDVPVSSFVLNLPVGPHSALTANGSLCTTARTIRVRKRIVIRRVHGRRVHLYRTITRRLTAALLMPTIITAQNGARVAQDTRITVAGCPGKSVHHRARHRKTRHHERRR